MSPRRGGDGAFSSLLSPPREFYLVGRQTIGVDPTVPVGDPIAQVDFFADERLIATDPPLPKQMRYQAALRPEAGHS